MTIEGSAEGTRVGKEACKFTGRPRPNGFVSEPLRAGTAKDSAILQMEEISVPKHNLKCHTKANK